jgi:hypothetical protein
MEFGGITDPAGTLSCPAIIDPRPILDPFSDYHLLTYDGVVDSRFLTNRGLFKHYRVPHDGFIP